MCSLGRPDLGPSPELLERGTSRHCERCGLLFIGYGDHHICAACKQTGTTTLQTTTGLSPDAPTTTTPQGGHHSATGVALHQLDPKLMLDLGRVLYQGGHKYGRDNWKKIPVEDHLNHALMHIFGCMMGDSQDEHLLHAIVRLMFAYIVDRDSDLYRSSEGDIS